METCFHFLHHVGYIFICYETIKPFKMLNFVVIFYGKLIFRMFSERSYFARELMWRIVYWKRRIDLVVDFDSTWYNRPRFLRIIGNITESFIKGTKSSPMARKRFRVKFIRGFDRTRLIARKGRGSRSPSLQFHKPVIFGGKSRYRFSFLYYLGSWK